MFTSYFKEIKFGFTPIITRTDFLHTVIQEIDITQILSETDSPYFTPDEVKNFISNYFIQKMFLFLVIKIFTLCSSWYGI